QDGLRQRARVDYLRDYSDSHSCSVSPCQELGALRGGRIMSSDVLYLIGAAATWLGWIALGVTLYRIFVAMTKRAGAARSAGIEGVASSAIASAAGFLIAIAVPMNAVKSAPGFKLPIVWIVM